jgi:hypothetical protein
MHLDLLNSFEGFNEFSEDWNSMSNNQLHHYAGTILSSKLVSDIVVIVRNLPINKNKEYNNIMSSVATLAGLMFNTWEDLESGGDMMGKMALVLESEEELNIMNIVKNNKRMILFVIELFK